MNDKKHCLNIALVAHDSRKKELVEWVKYNMKVLSEHKLYATGTTGRLIKEIYYTGCHDENSDLIRGVIRHYPFKEKVTCLHSGPLGGDQEIGSMIANGEIDVLIFFCDNLIQQGHQNDVSALTRLASLYNIAFATNRTTADMILTSSLFGDPNYQKVIPQVIENYKNRQI